MADNVKAEDKIYFYAAKVTNVVDGDTLDLYIELGFDIGYALRVRLYGVNAPEKVGATKVAGLDATKFVKDAVLGKSVTARTFLDKKEKFGRFLATIFYDKAGVETNLNDELVANGLAKPCFGGKR